MYKKTTPRKGSGGGDYILGLKANQETFHDEVSLYLDDCISSGKIEVETAKTKAGKSTERSYYITGLDTSCEEPL